MFENVTDDGKIRGVTDFLEGGLHAISLGDHGVTINMTHFKFISHMFYSDNELKQKYVDENTYDGY